MKLIQEVHTELRRDIFNAKYKPNELLTERQIAERYGVSKVTAGEALHMLCSEGHLTAYPRSGYMVTTPSAQEMAQLKRLRKAVEGLSLDILCQEASEEALRSLYGDIVAPEEVQEEHVNGLNTAFHMHIASLTGDKYIISLTETLLGTASRVQQYVSPAMQAHWQDFHKGIVDALLSRDVNEARRLLISDIDQR